jgi:hypothetical protein
MARGPKGERRPADVIGNAVKVMRIATGEETETLPADDGEDPAAKALGKKGGAARAKSSSATAPRQIQQVDLGVTKPLWLMSLLDRHRFVEPSSS